MSVAKRLIAESWARLNEASHRKEELRKSKKLKKRLKHEYARRIVGWAEPQGENSAKSGSRPGPRDFLVNKGSVTSGSRDVDDSKDLRKGVTRQNLFHDVSRSRSGHCAVDVLFD